MYNKSHLSNLLLFESIWRPIYAPMDSRVHTILFTLLDKLRLSKCILQDLNLMKLNIKYALTVDKLKVTAAEKGMSYS